MAVITISRELGSEGDRIAELLCQELGYQRVDKDLITQIAQEAGVDVEVVRAKEQSFTQRNKLVSSEMRSLYSHQPATFEQKTSFDDQTYLQTTRKIIEKYAEQGNAVIVGRGGQIVLREWPAALHLHFYAPPEVRSRRLAQRLGISENDARQRIATSDEEKKRYIAHLYNHADWKDLRFYHLVINTALLAPETAAKVIVRARQLHP